MTNKNPKKVSMGKKSRAAGGRFELKVRKDLEKKWIVGKWPNTVEFYDNPKWFPSKDDDEYWKKQQELSNKPICKKCETFPCLCNLGPRKLGKCFPAKRKYNPFNRALTIGTGFPDFFIYKQINLNKEESNWTVGEFAGPCKVYEIIFVESKMKGILSREEKDKAKWYLKHNYCSKFLIAKKGEKRGQIEYVEFN